MTNDRNYIIYKILLVITVSIMMLGVGSAAPIQGNQLQNYAPVQSAIKQAITDENFSLADIEGVPEYSIKILEQNDTYIKLVSNTKITFKNPRGAGFGNPNVVQGVSSFNSNIWPKFQINKPIGITNEIQPTTTNNTNVDYDQQIKDSILAEINNVTNVTERTQLLDAWNNYSFESGSRTFEFNETYEATYSKSVGITKILPKTGEVSTDVLMGFTQPISWKYSREDNLYLHICFLKCWNPWVAWTKLDAIADGSLGLRLPVTVSLQMPDSMIRGTSYNLYTNIIGKDWSADQYIAANVPSENGNEFIARTRFSLSVQARIRIIGNIGPYDLIDKNIDYGSSFKTPFGSNEKFPIPVWTLSPDQTGLKISYGNNLAYLWIGVGLKIEPILGSDKITANWIATGDSIGDGQIEYHEPNINYNFGPVKADDYDPRTDYASIKLSDYNYYFTVCRIDLDANVQGGLYSIIGSLAIQTPYVTIYSYDCGGATGGLHLGAHPGTYADQITGYSLVGKQNDIDIIPPQINDVTFVNVEPNIGESVSITVNATDNVKVTKVTANGVLLTNNPNNQDIWNGDIIAEPTVHVIAQDSSGNEATTDTSYQPGEGYWYQGSGGVALDIGQTSIVDLKSPRNVNNAYVQVGCNDGEGMDGYIEYLEAGTWKNLISFTGAGCGQYLDFPVITTTGLKLIMTGGGGSDGRISWYSLGSNGWKVYALGPQIFLDRLNPGDSLKIDQFILSQNGRFKLIMQGDGNLVLYDLNTGKARWATGTNGKPVSFTIMQEDGNLVLYNSNYKPYWDSRTWGRNDAWLIVQNDGNVVIYDINYKPLWATGTNSPN